MRFFSIKYIQLLIFTIFLERYQKYQLKIIDFSLYISEQFELNMFFINKVFYI